MTEQETLDLIHDLKQVIKELEADTQYWKVSVLKRAISAIVEKQVRLEVKRYTDEVR